ncbi:MAG: hypothetical protein RH859_08145 [Longimicrobiales bacterium]
MTTLKIDPWDPEYGGSVELDDDLTPPPVDLDVEDGGWEPRIGHSVSDIPCCAFVDGVRRIDVRLFAEQDAAVAPALAGSWAVGASWATQPPRIDNVHVGRALVVGGGLSHPELIASLGAQPFHYPCTSVAGTAPVDPIHGLQNLMREAEAVLAAEILEMDEADLLLLDGPLTYLSAEGPVVGLIKRQSRAYLPPERSGVLAELGCGARTPVFRIHHQRLERYSWYVRIAGGRGIDGVMTGIVRLEVSSSLGMDRSVALADLTASILPRFASKIGRDPRAPQNLYPVGQLETVLRHRLGDATLLRRTLEAAIWRNLSKGMTDE